jgi:hypothetical protein
VADNEESIEEVLAEPLSKKRGQAYARIIEDIFFRFYQEGDTEFEFERAEIEVSAELVGEKRPKNLGDVIYAFRHRRALPARVLETQTDGRYWFILGAGDARYRFRLSSLLHLVPTKGLLVRKIPDATPQIIEHYTLKDEQALLAKVRYNRLVDIFLGITVYSLQNHLRTRIDNYGQIEIDELYVGLDTAGTQYIVPVQAKGGRDKLGVIQTIQDITYCQVNQKYSACVARAVSAQFIGRNREIIAMFELIFDGNDVSIVRERHYSLVPASEIGKADLDVYRRGD